MSTKISALPPSAGLVLTDIFPVVDDPGGTPVTQKATFAQLQTLLSAGMVASFNTRVGAVTLTLADVSTVADARYVLKAGDTMTGLLTIDTSLATSLRAITTDAGTTNAAQTVEIYHRSTATPAVGFGNRFQFYANTNGGVDQIQGRIDLTWTDAVDATRASQMSLITRNTGVALNTALILKGAQLLAQNGVVGAPAFTFQAEPSSGMWLNAPGNLSFSVSGVLAVSYNATGINLLRSVNFPYVAKTATYTASAVDFTIDCTSGTFTINLPTAVGITGRIYVIKNSGVGTITIDPSGAQLIDGLATSPVTSGGAAMIQSNGAGWIII